MIVKVGSFYNDYPKYLIIQLEYPPFTIMKKKIEKNREL